MNSRSNGDFILVHPGQKTDAVKNNAIDKSIVEIPKYFKHITFNTGHVSDDYWDAENNVVSMEMSNFISKTLITEGLSVVPLQKKNWPLRLSVDGTNLMTEMYVPQDRPKNNPFAICFGVAVDAYRGEKLWQALHDRAEQGALKLGIPKQLLCLAGDSDEPPKEPWIAALLTVDIERALKDPEWYESYVQLMCMAAQFESSLAWGFAEWLRKHPQT